MLPRLLLVSLSALPLLAQDLPGRAVHILQEQCGSCHNGSVAMSGLRLDSKESLLKGGNRGPAVKPGSASASLLIQAVGHTGKLTMPPGKKLSAEDVGLLSKWVDSGVSWPEAATALKCGESFEMVVLSDSCTPDGPGHSGCPCANAHRCFHPFEVTLCKTIARSGSRPQNIHPTGIFRPARFASHRREDGGVRSGQIGGCLREAHR